MFPNYFHWNFIFASLKWYWNSPVIPYKNKQQNSLNSRHPQHPYKASPRSIFKNMKSIHHQKQYNEVPPRASMTSEKVACSRTLFNEALFRCQTHVTCRFLPYSHLSLYLYFSISNEHSVNLIFSLRCGRNLLIMVVWCFIAVRENFPHDVHHSSIFPRVNVQGTGNKFSLFSKLHGNGFCFPLPTPSHKNCSC